MDGSWKHDDKRKKPEIKTSHTVQFHLNERFRINKSTEAECRLMDTRGWKEGRTRKTVKSTVKFNLGVMEMCVN